MIILNYPKFWQRRSIVSYILLPLSLIYTLAAYLRFLIVGTRHLPCKVICVGNPTVGGAGKTQVVISIARNFIKDGIKFAIISKGYKGCFVSPTIVTTDMDARIVGDEALELAKYGTTIVSKRVIDAEDHVSKISPDVVIVDDGLQNPSFYKDYKIAVIDSERGFGNEFPLPAGPMRMPAVLEDADVILSIGKKDITEGATKCKITPVTELDKNRKYFAFAGIGNPERFFDGLKASSIILVGSKSFPDHHFFSDLEIKELKKDAEALGSSLITTAKDYVKIKPLDRSDIICYEVRLSISEEEKFMKDIYEKIFQEN
ncbi:MAG: tetraacyldisaccharide 4'-kinase [Rickettsiaceae bacterium]|nr:tetraacyldisaccharide 4'-kinase [Rickettsiaceae bacterium]